VSTARVPRRPTLALVESATQLLNVAEWAHATGEAAEITVAVLGSREAHTARQLNRVGELVAGLGLDLRHRPVRRRTPPAATGAAQVAAALARADRLIVGDPFSRLVQALLPLATARDVVVVDDGTATWEFARCLDEGRPLQRWGAAPGRGTGRAGRATGFFAPGPHRHLTVFSCLNDAAPRGAVALANRYEWTRGWRRPEVSDDEVDVLGVSLVDSGLVRRAAYLAAVAELARRHAPVRYIAHRRESAGLLTEIARLPGLRVVRNDLPVELALRRGPVARRVLAFPSTAAHTLPVVLGDVGVRVRLRPVAPEWFAAGATPHAREFIARIAAAAPPSRPVPPSRPWLESV
jgi:hypothetical protein